MECASQRSFATWRLRIFRQLALSHQPRLPRRAFSSTHEQRAEPEEARSDEAEPYNADPDNGRPSQQLPQSPILTHPRHEKKQRKRQPTRDDLIPLIKNPWAVALASPVRQCTVTGVRLPRALLGEWGLVRRPGTESNYMLPVGLLEDSLRGHDVSVRGSTPVPMSTGQEMPNDGEKGSWEHAFTANPVRQEKLGRHLRFRIFDHLPILRELSTRLPRMSGKVPLAAKLLPFRWKHPQGPVTPREEKNIVWMDDMPEYVLQKMREDVVKKLEKAYRWYPILGAKDGVWNIMDVDEKSNSSIPDALERLEPVDRMECGVILTQSSTEAMDLNGGAHDYEDIPETWVVPGVGKTVPQFDLSVLLGSNLALLRQGMAAEHFRHSALFFRPDDEVTIDALLSLWKLQQYIYRAHWPA